MRRRVARTEARRRSGGRGRSRNVQEQCPRPRTRPAFNSHVLGGRNMAGLGIGKFGNMRAQAA